MMAPLLFAGGIVTMAVTIFKEAKWGFYLLILLIPQPNIWYKFHKYYLGSNYLDFLYFAIVLGIFFQSKKLAINFNVVVVVLFVVLSYIALWNSSTNYGLPLPVTTDNRLLFEWKNYAQMILLYLLAMVVASDEAKQKMTVVVMAAVILFVSVRCFRNFNALTTFRYDRRIAGPFETVNLGSNHFAAFIVYSMVFLLGLLIFDKDRSRRALYVVAFCFSLFPFFFAYSRGAYVAGLAVLIVFGVLHKRILLVVACVILVGWQTLLPESVVDRITMTRSADGEIERSAAHRLNLWNYAMGLYERNPVFGAGFGSFGMEVPEGELTDTHNYYVKTLVEQGVVGLVVLLFVVQRALQSGWKLYRRAQSDFQKGLGFGFLGCVIACIITNMFGDRWSYFVLNGYLWILWGMVDRSLSVVENA